MSGFNKVTSFILGLIVVLVFLFVFGSRVNLSDKLLAFKDTRVTPTPKVVVLATPTPTIKKKGFFESLFGRKTPTVTPTPKIIKLVEDNTNGMTAGTTTTSATFTAAQPQSIPQTGPSLLFPIFISAFGAGMYLRKKN